jgi:hypothetical protein
MVYADRNGRYSTDMVSFASMVPASEIEAVVSYTKRNQINQKIIYLC